MTQVVTWDGVSYNVPDAGEVGWQALTDFLVALGTKGAIAEEMKQAVRVATSSPVTVSDTTDCVVLTKLAVAGAVTVNLPAGTNGRWFVVADQTGDAGTNNVTINPNGAETINGSASYVLNVDRGAVVLVYSSTNTRWNVVARFVAGTPMVNPLTTTGDTVYSSSGTTPARLGIGTNGDAYVVASGIPAWTSTFTTAKTVKVTDAGTTTTPTLATVNHASSGTPSTGFGSSIDFLAQSSTTADQTQANIVASWTTATHASRTSKLEIKTVSSGSAATALTLAGDGSFTAGASGANITHTANCTNFEIKSNQTSTTNLLVENTNTGAGVARIQIASNGSGGTGDAFLLVQANNNGGSPLNWHAGVDNSAGGFSIGNSATVGNGQVFFSDGTNVRIGASGTGPTASHSVYGSLSAFFANSNPLNVVGGQATGSARQIVRFTLGATAHNNGTASGGILATDGSTAPSFYTGSSDERLKEGIEDAKPGALSRISQIRLRDFWIKGETDRPKIRGVIAQELQTVYPDHVIKRDEEGDLLTVAMGWDWELIQAIQELKAEVETLRAQLASK